MGQTISERLEHLRKPNSDRQWINVGSTGCATGQT
jgi:hypothetical protein